MPKSKSLALEFMGPSRDPFTNVSILLGLTMREMDQCSRGDLTSAAQEKLTRAKKLAWDAVNLVANAAATGKPKRRSR